MSRLHRASRSKNSGSGNLTLRADASGIDNGGSIANHGTLDWSASTGIVSALYDMTGTYSPGTVLTNSAWTAAPFSGSADAGDGLQARQFAERLAAGIGGSRRQLRARQGH